MKVVAVMGPTASGKSALAFYLARELHGEIVNADSMQVFRGLSIGTNVPPREWFAEVPHHLYEYLDPTAEPDAAMWAEAAASIIEAIWKRGRLPIVVGGTFFWMKALFEGFSPVPKVPKEIRLRLSAMGEKAGLEAMYEWLCKVDPEAAARIGPHNRQRILRALEVYEATGTPLSWFQRHARKPAVIADCLKIALKVPRQELYSRIEARVAEMVSQGLVDEVRALLEQGVSPAARPLMSSSYRPVVRFILGECDEETMRRDVAMAHRRYAKRQMTWLRHEPGVVWFDYKDCHGIMSCIKEFLIRPDQSSVQ